MVRSCRIRRPVRACRKPSATSRHEGAKREIVPLASLLLPALGSVSFTVAKNERSIAMLRVIEALRIHAARHQGRLPEKLADISAVPLPLDPTTRRGVFVPEDRRHRGPRIALSAGPPAPRRSAPGGEV